MTGDGMPTSRARAGWRAGLPSVPASEHIDGPRSLGRLRLGRSSTSTIRLADFDGSRDDVCARSRRLGLLAFHRRRVRRRVAVHGPTPTAGTDHRRTARCTGDTDVGATCARKRRGWSARCRPAPGSVRLSPARRGPTPRASSNPSMDDDSPRRRRQRQPRRPLARDRRRRLPSLHRRRLATPSPVRPSPMPPAGPTWTTPPRSDLPTSTPTGTSTSAPGPTPESVAGPGTAPGSTRASWVPTGTTRPVGTTSGSTRRSAPVIWTATAVRTSAAGAPTAWLAISRRAPVSVRRWRGPRWPTPWLAGLALLLHHPLRRPAPRTLCPATENCNGVERRLRRRNRRGCSGPMPTRTPAATSPDGFTEADVAADRRRDAPFSTFGEPGGADAPGGCGCRVPCRPGGLGVPCCSHLRFSCGAARGEEL